MKQLTLFNKDKYKTKSKFTAKEYKIYEYMLNSLNPDRKLTLHQVSRIFCKGFSFITLCWKYGYESAKIFIKILDYNKYK